MTLFFFSAYKGQSFYTGKYYTITRDYCNIHTFFGLGNGWQKNADKKQKREMFLVSDLI